MEFMKVVRERRSCRNFLPDQISDDLLQEILEAGRLAPSGGNGQNCYYGVIRDEELKSELARAAGEQMWIATAPVVIAYCAALDADLKNLPDDDFGLIVNRDRFGEEFIHYQNQYPDRKVMNKFWNNANPLIPGEHIFLAAVNHGLRACWVGYLDTERAAKILTLPEDMVCLFLMPLGYPAEKPDDIERKELSELVFYDRWDK